MRSSSCRRSGRREPAGTRSSCRAFQRVLHAGLTIRDEQRANTFYKDVLGFSEIWRGGRPEGVTQWVNMRVPDGTEYLEYMLISSQPDRRQRGDAAPCGAARARHPDGLGRGGQTNARIGARGADAAERRRQRPVATESV